MYSRQECSLSQVILLSWCQSDSNLFFRNLLISIIHSRYWKKNVGYSIFPLKRRRLLDDKMKFSKFKKEKESRKVL